MPFGLGIGQVVALVRETRGFEGALPQISVSGEGASELALSLSTGGDAGAVLVGSDPGQAVVAIRLIDGEASAAEIAMLRRISRSEAGLIVVRRGDGHVPYVLPGDIIETEAELPLRELLKSIARACRRRRPGPCRSPAHPADRGRAAADLRDRVRECRDRRLDEDAAGRRCRCSPSRRAAWC